MTSSPTESPLLEVRGARLARGGAPVLGGVDLALAGGEWLALLGPNGAGKTTLLAAAAGLLALDEGTVRVCGRAAGAAAPASLRRAIGLVPQQPAVHGTLSVRENLRVFGALHGVPRARLPARVDHALGWSGLEVHAGKPAGRLSGGMQRRLSIACALLHEPRVVLLDEPTVGVDPQARERILEMLAGLRADGVGLLQSTHLFDEAERVCDRVVVMDGGRVLAEGRVEEVVSRTAGVRPGVSITLAPGTPVPAVAGLTRDGDVLRGEVADPGRDLPRLLDALVAAGARVLGVEARPATLDDAFFALTGRSLRE